MKGAAAQAGEKLADGWLTTKIQAQFFADEDVKSRYINVATPRRRGDAEGIRRSDDARRQVLEITRNTDGVKQIDDRQLLVGRPANRVVRNSVKHVHAGARRHHRRGAGHARAVGRRNRRELIQAKFFLDPTIKARQHRSAGGERCGHAEGTGGQRDRARAGTAAGALDAGSAARRGLYDGGRGNPVGPTAKAQGLRAGPGRPDLTALALRLRLAFLRIQE